ncbi:MAG: MarR family transcriptional regulator [Erysipelotrichaceae bacterium]|nr:MarR family transcriptional regulator [Erysipelotrichaceae bacterium]
MQNNDIGYLIKKIGLLQKAGMDASLQEYDLTSSQFRVLIVLHKHGGSLTQKELEEELGVSHPTVSGLVKRLEKQGYLFVATDPSDRRNRIVSLSEKTKDAEEDLRLQRQKAEEKLTEGMSEEEVKILRGYLERMYENIRPNREGEEVC